MDLLRELVSLLEMPGKTPSIEASDQDYVCYDPNSGSIVCSGMDQAEANKKKQEHSDAHLVVSTHNDYLKKYGKKGAAPTQHKEFSGITPIKPMGSEYKFNARESLDENKWVANVVTKEHSPEGLFATGTAEKIVAWLNRAHKDKKGAVASLDFYMNRAGKNLSTGRKRALDAAKKLLMAKGQKEAAGNAVQGAKSDGLGHKDKASKSAKASFKKGAVHKKLKEGEQIDELLRHHDFDYVVHWGGANETNVGRAQKGQSEIIGFEEAAELVKKKMKEGVGGGWKVTFDPNSK